MENCAALRIVRVGGREGGMDGELCSLEDCKGREGVRDGWRIVQP